MSLIPVQYFDGISAKAQEGFLAPHGEGIELHIGSERRVISPKHYSVQGRIGQMPPSIELKDGAQIRLLSDEIPAWLNKKTSTFSNGLHRLESRLPYAIGAFLLVIVAGCGFIKYGIPAVSEKIAMNLPESTSQMLGAGTLDALDQLYFEPTQTAQAVQASYQKAFKALSPSSNYTLVFRDGGPIGANAFALPDGTVVVTDQLIHLANNQEEVLSVLAHELGHLDRRHSLRLVIANSAVAVIVTTLTGDMNGLAGLIGSGLPTMLSHASYAQSFEKEADLYARELMQERGIPLHHFADMLSRIAGDADEESSGWSNYVSSHPPTKERIKPFLEDKAN